MKNAGRLLIAVVGLSEVFAGLGLLLQPVRFFESFGHFPPYNQHYEGDAGAFVLALGIGLLVAAARPASGRWLVAVGSIGGLVHLLNHIYASSLDGSTWVVTVIVALQLVGIVAGALLVYRASAAPGGS